MSETNSKSPNLLDVSRLAGVSATTVCRVLNNSPIPTEETRRRVLEAVKAAGYQPGTLNRDSLRRRRQGHRNASSRTRLVGLLNSPVINVGVVDGYYNDVLTAMSTALSQHDYHMVFCTVERGASAVPSIVAEDRVDGLLIETDLDESLREYLAQRLPVVFVDRVYAGISADAVGMNYAGAAREVLSYLWQLGHRNIALLTDMADTYYNRQARESYRAFYESRGLPLPCPELSAPLQTHPAIHQQAVASYAARFLAAKPRPTAVICSCNGYAFDLLTPLRSAGIEIPRDLSVASLNDQGRDPLVSSILTSYQVPMAQIGIEAAELLTRRIANRERPGCEFLVQGKMIVRASCAPV